MSTLLPFLSLSREHRIFLQKYVAYTILSRNTCGGEQKFFLRINLHSNAHKVIETIFADWTLFCWKTCKISRELRIVLQRYVAYIIYLERHVVESKNYFWELISIVMLTRLSRRFLLIGPSFAEKRVRLAENFEFFFKNMLLTLFYLERHVVESKNSFWELIS